MPALIRKLKERIRGNSAPVGVKLLCILSCLMTLHVIVIFYAGLIRGLPSRTMVFCLFRIWMTRGLFAGLLWLIYSKGPALWAVRFMRGAVYLKYALCMLGTGALAFMFIVFSDPASLFTLLGDTAALALGVSILFFLHGRLWLRLERMLHSWEEVLRGEQKLPLTPDGWLLSLALLCIAVLNLCLSLFCGEEIAFRIAAILAQAGIDPHICVIPTFFFGSLSAAITHLLNIAALTVIFIGDFRYCRREYRARVLPVIKENRMHVRELSDFLDN